VGPALEFSQKRETGEVFIINPSHLKNAVRTHLDTITFSLASIAIYHGLVGAGIRRALLSGSVWVPCRPPGFFRIQLQLVF
jgi:hypothetical protein